MSGKIHGALKGTLDLHGIRNIPVLRESPAVAAPAPATGAPEAGGEQVELLAEDGLGLEDQGGSPWRSLSARR